MLPALRVTEAASSLRARPFTGAGIIASRQGPNTLGRSTGNVKRMSQTRGATLFETAGPARLAPRGRELEVAGEIAHAVLHAARPLEVYRLALDRVTPLVGARFSSVFLREPAEPTLLRLECAHNWPQSAARFLSQLRIRVGRGPTGRAVLEGRAIEASDLFADPTLRDWWEPARELGFASLIAIPLMSGDQVAGALTFYFDRPHRFDDGERRLLALIADQLAANASRAHLIEELHHANERLNGRNTDLSRRLEESHELRRLKDEFLSNVSHELRTPLTSILGYAELIGEGEMGPLTERQAAAVKRIEAAGTALLRLITDLLDLSQLKLDRVRPCRGIHDAAELARNAVAAAGAPPDGVDFTLHVPEAAISIVTDGDKVQRILAKLISNAFKFTAHGQISVRVQMLLPSRVTWVVADTGIGIEAQNREAVFDEFRQVDGSTTRLYGGTGLGLALSRRLARLLGGDIELESRPGTGSTFSLTLPVRPNPTD